MAGKTKALTVVKDTKKVVPRKIVDTTLTQASVTDMIIQQVEKECGKGAIIRLADMNEKPPTFPSDIPMLDEMLHGGIIQGGIVEILGGEQSGKTALALHLAGRHNDVLYLDGERAITKGLAERYGGHGNYVIFRPYWLEQALMTAVMFIKAGTKLVVLDSLPSIPCRKQFEAKDMEKQEGMALTAGLLSRVLGGINSLCYDHGATLIIVNQLRANMNVSSPWAEQAHGYGGNMLPAITQLRLGTVRTGWLTDATLLDYGSKNYVGIGKCKYAASRRGVVLPLVFSHGIVTPEQLPGIRAELREWMKTGRYIPTTKDKTKITETEVAEAEEYLENLGD